MTELIKQRIEMINRGEVPEGYKKTKVGIVPREWAINVISECLVRIANSVTVEKATLYTQIGIRSHGKGLFYKEPVSGEDLGNKSVFWIEPNCFILNIVFAWEQAIGKTTANEIGMIASHRFPMYRPKDGKLNIDYLISYLLTKRGTTILDDASPGGAGRNRTLGQDNFMKSKIMLPPLPEQEKIAEILSTQDKVIELKQKLINEKKQQKKWLMQQLLTGGIRLKGFSGEWKKVRIGLFLSESKIIETNLDINKRITVKLNLKGIEKRQTKTIESEDATIQYRRSVGQFIYGKQNLHKGAFGIIPLELNNYQSSSDIPSFDFSDNVNGLWFFYFLSRENYYTQLENIATGTGSKRIQPNEFLNISIPFPPLPEQTAIASILSTQDKEIELLEKDLEQEKQKKKALMQLLLTGKVRVNV